MTMLKYKISSDFVNIPLSENKITQMAKTYIDIVANFLDAFEVKKDFILYRGDKSFNILSKVKYDGKNFGFPELIEAFTTAIKQDYINGKYDKIAVANFIQKYLIGKDVPQARFLSTGMTPNSIKEYAKKIKWTIKVPAGTKGASIESYNIERGYEAEFLGQRNCVLNIIDAKYNPKEDMWYFDAILEQKQPIDEIVVNC